MFLTSLKQICNGYLIKFSENQSAPKLENRKTSPYSRCAPNLLHMLISRIPGYHNLCSPDLESSGHHWPPLTWYLLSTIAMIRPEKRIWWTCSLLWQCKVLLLALHATKALSCIKYIEILCCLVILKALKSLLIGSLFWRLCASLFMKINNTSSSKQLLEINDTYLLISKV